jgi:hypothetical protein
MTAVIYDLAVERISRRRRLRAPKRARISGKARSPKPASPRAVKRALPTPGTHAAVKRPRRRLPPGQRPREGREIDRG